MQFVILKNQILLIILEMILLIIIKTLNLLMKSMLMKKN